MDGFALSEEEGSQINFRGTKMVVKVSGDDSEGRYSLIEMVHPPNIGPALHIHPNAPEADQWQIQQRRVYHTMW